MEKNRKIFGFIIAITALGVLISGCITETKEKTGSVIIAIPIVTSISPEAAFSSQESLILTVYGDNFHSNSIVLINNTEQPTEFISDKEIQCSVSFETIVEKSESHEKKGTHQICEVQVKNDAIKISSPINWPIRNSAFDFSLPHQFAEVNQRHVNWDMEVDNQNGVHVVQEHFVLPNGCENCKCFGELIIVSSYDNGQTWNDPVLIRKQLLGFCDSTYGLSVSLDLIVNNEGHLFIAYDENTRFFDDFGRIGVLVSRDRGKTWEETIIVRRANSLFLNQIFIVGNHTLIIYTDKEWNNQPDSVPHDNWIMLHSTDSGKIWETILKGSNGIPKIGYHPQEKRCYLFVSPKTGSFRDYRKTSIDYGLTWTEPTELLSHLIVNQIVFGFSNILHIISAHPVNNLDFPEYEYYYRNSADDGDTWENDITTLFNHIAIDSHGLIYGAEKHLHLGNADGRIWQQVSPDFLSNASGENKIRIDHEDNVHLLYRVENQDGQAWQNRIYYTRSE